MKHLETFESACSFLGKEATLPIINNIDPKHSKALVAVYKLFIISEAAWKHENEEINWNNDDQRKFYPWFDLSDSSDNSSGSALGFSFGYYDYDCSNSGVGSRLVFPSRKVAEFVGETHLELYKDFMAL